MIVFPVFPKVRFLVGFPTDEADEEMEKEPGQSISEIQFCVDSVRRSL
jgi:hypothetical protein